MPAPKGFGDLTQSVQSSPEQGHHQPRATPPSGRVLHERAGSARRLHWAVTGGGMCERGRLAPVGARGGAALPAATGRGLDAVVPPEWRTWLDALPAPRPQTPTLRFIAVDEERPGPRWSALYGETWEAYRGWWLGGKGSRPDRATAAGRLRRHMPEPGDVHGGILGL